MVRSHYNLIAGQSVERLAALSDGVFAVAMTLLVLDLHAPAMETIHSERDLLHALGALAPRLLVYFMSFLTLGIFWVGQQTQLNQIERGTRDFAWIHLMFLLAVSITPFSTALMAEFIGYRVALVVYWLNILLLGVILFGSWRYALSANITRPDMPADTPPAVQQRIVIAQALYAFGALLCIWSTYLSLAFIVTVQLYYGVAPRLRRRTR